MAVSVETNVRAKSNTQPLLVAKAPLRQSRIEDQDASLTDRKSVLSDQIPPDLLPARTISFPPQTVSKQAYLSSPTGNPLTTISYSSSTFGAS